MNKFFTFYKKGDSHQILRIAAKVFRVLYIVSAIVTSIYVVLMGSGVAEGLFDVGYFVLSLLFASFSFVVIMLMGMLIEAVWIGFANIVENQFEELVLKNKAEEQEVNFGLGKKDNVSFEKIKKLNELKKSGAISEEEFEEKKKELMENI